MHLPPVPGHDSTAQMAACMIEEYALMGFARDRLLDMFKNPHYQALYTVYRTRGEEFVNSLMDTVYQHG